jgi:PilZ domain
VALHFDASIQDMLEPETLLPLFGDHALSRIWNALRQAEKERARAARSHPPAKAETEPVNRRRSPRSRPPVSLLIYGSGVDKQPFHEEADILNANERGCLISLENAVNRGQRLFLVNLSNQDELECRVVRIGKLQHGKRHVALEFLRSAPEFWFYT